MRGFGAAMLVVRRRAARDLTLLVVWTALVAFAVLLSVAAPRLLVGVLNQGARESVADAGSGADVVVGTTVGKPERDPYNPVVSPASILSLAAALPSRMPSGIAKAYANTTVTVLAAPAPIAAVNGVPVPSSSDVQVGLGMLTIANLRALKLVQGTLPSSTGTDGAADVVLSAAALKAADLKLGSIFELPGVPGENPAKTVPPIRLRVVGVVRESNAALAGSYAGASAWQDMPYLWSPRVPTISQLSEPIEVTALMQPDAVASVARSGGVSFAGQIRLRLNPAVFTSALEATVNDNVASLATSKSEQSRLSGSTLSIHSGFKNALSDYPAQSRAALSQLSIMLAGVVGVAAAVLVLLSRLIVLRRGNEIALERARGASLAAIAGRVLSESAVGSIVGGVVGVGGAWLVIAGPFTDPFLLVTVLFVAVVAAPVQTVLIARAIWTGKREPANRQDRFEIEKRRRVRRLAVEGTLVVLAIAALVSLRNRGLLQASATGIDAFLALAPLLFAVVVTIVVLRIYRWPIRVVGALGRRSPGVLGLLGAVRAERAIAALPLLALTLAGAIAVGGGLLGDTVEAGQITASWQRVGADVRVDAPISAATVTRVAGERGVTAAGSALVATELQMKLGSSTDFATMLAIDDHYPGVVKKLPDDPGPQKPSDASILSKLAKPTPASSPLPVVVDTSIANRLATRDIAVYYKLKLVQLSVVGTTDSEPAGYLGGPFFYVDRSALAERMSQPLSASMLLIIGPGASRAAGGLHVASADIHSRTGWLAHRRQLALVAGVQSGLLLSVLAVALLAMIALVATVVAGARERGRSLSLLRTLGLSSRLGWWLALAELAPIVAAALLGGIAAGVGMVLLLEPSMGFAVLAGGLSIPPPSISISMIGGIAGATVVLLGVAVLVEMLAYRRSGLSEVLRVGETV